MLCVVKKSVRDKGRARPESRDRMTANRGRQLTSFWQWHTQSSSGHQEVRGPQISKSRLEVLVSVSTWRTAAAVTTVLGARWIDFSKGERRPCTVILEGTEFLSQQHPGLNAGLLKH